MSSCIAGKASLTGICIKSLAVVVAMGMATTAFAANGGYGDCNVTGPTGVVKLKTVTPDTLTVRPWIPAPGFWNGDSLTTVKSGYEYCLAAYIAYRAGLDHLKLVSESFAQVVAGQTDKFDIAISEITITPKRAKVVDFTVPYRSVITAVMVRSGTRFDPQSLRDMRIGTERATTMVPFIKQKIRPTKPLKVFTSTASMYAALAARQVDAVIYDAGSLRTVSAQSNGRFKVAGIFPASAKKIGGLVGKGSPNLAAFNKIIEGLKKDGVLARLAKQYLVPLYGGIPLSRLPHLTAPFDTQ